MDQIEIEAQALSFADATVASGLKFGCHWVVTGESCGETLVGSRANLSSLDPVRIFFFGS